MFDEKAKNRLSRLDWLDRVKGIGILFVMIGHVYVEDGFFSRIIHALNVPLFFIASGYLIAFKREWEHPCKEIICKKMHSILRPYFLYSAVMMLWLFLRLFIVHYGSFYEIFHCLADIFCLEGISVLWFLSALFIGQILSVFSFKTILRYSKNSKTNDSKIHGRLACIAVILMLLFAVCAYIFSNFINWIQSVSGWIVYKLILKTSRILGRGVMAAVFIFAGMFLCLLEKNNQKEINQKENDKKEINLQTRSHFQVFLAAAVFLLILSLTLLSLWHNGLRDFHYFNFGNFWLYLLNGILGFICVAYSSRLAKQEIFLRFLGKNSLLMMATHLIFLDFINILAVRLSVPLERNLGDAWGAKLFLLMLAELFLIYGNAFCKFFLSNKKRSNHHQKLEE